jgi:hypothetical protein
MNRRAVTIEDITNLEGQINKLRTDKADLHEIFKLEDKCAAYYISKMALEQIMDKLKNA